MSSGKQIRSLSHWLPNVGILSLNLLSPKLRETAAVWGDPGVYQASHLIAPTGTRGLRAKGVLGYNMNGSEKAARKERRLIILNAPPFSCQTPAGRRKAIGSPITGQRDRLVDGLS